MDGARYWTIAAIVWWAILAVCALATLLTVAIVAR